MTPQRPARVTPSMRRVAGFTLIELLVALGLMAVVSLLGWRGLDTVLRSRDGIVEQSDAMRALSIAFGQLEDDLRRSWPVRVPGAQPIGFRTGGDAGPVFEVLREAPGVGGALVQRAVWRVREGALERGVAAWSPDTAGAAERSPPLPAQWQPLVDEVVAVTIRGFIPGQGWLGAESLSMRSSAMPGVAAPQVTGVEVSLERSGGQRVLRVFTVRD